MIGEFPSIRRLGNRFQIPAHVLRRFVFLAILKKNMKCLSVFIMVPEVSMNYWRIYLIRRASFNDTWKKSITIGGRSIGHFPRVCDLGF